MNKQTKERCNQAMGSELGKKTIYDDHYNPGRLYPIPRAGKRQEIGIDSTVIPFFGFDTWNHYEVSWLNDRGKPEVAIAEIVYGCHSPMIVESKSLKLYFNSFNNAKFPTIEALEQVIKQDLEKNIESDVIVHLTRLQDANEFLLQKAFDGECIDHLDVACSVYHVNPDFLSISHEQVEEILYSDLLKSNCLVTNQPDWGSVQIHYKGNKIDREGLLKYIVSFRNHNEFHEQCIERIYMDIMKHCCPSELSVHGRYTRRGGLDINPFRSSNRQASYEDKNIRLIRQ
ncbi:NADPH-dependent 7-cyano-7-deazaguanine reductase QueF [Legionella nagasakiensis]|uniref:NADPH-dependent 7-cyano-7-deazaguanine reductase QueF n=1 Tax=Legionella nagasakiensis TaxID=535290 RepID=UPI00105443EE|nr:NADPH-dependent 7-cyano-7-deazaguanine reductase QueF [Legionella nagasakiensis]